jgi:sugar lactone lactonase YvrE
VEPVSPATDQLGEAPHWDDRSGRLLRVDATAGRIVWLDPATGGQSVTCLDDSVGFAIPCATVGIVVGVGRQVRVMSETGASRVIAVAEDRPGTRFNDGKCDPAGRLWAGTMSVTDEPGAGSLYRVLSGTESETVVTGLTVFNGPAWNVDGDRMYFADSPTGRIDRFDYDLASGRATGRRPFVQFAEGEGVPDGMTIDAEDCLWVCAFEGGEVRRYDQSGVLVDRCVMPVSNPTSLAFGGTHLDVLYVTSAQHRLSRGQLVAEPLAGAVFALDPGVKGLPAARCAFLTPRQHAAFDNHQPL